MVASYFFSLIALLFILLGGGLWIGISLFITSFIGLTVFTTLPPINIFATLIWNNVNSEMLIALPLFILMGEILVKTDIASKLFKGLSPWVYRIPGKLLHVNIFACTFLAAISGSVGATTATVGKITIPEFKKRNYSDKLSIGSLSCASTVGIMIPPSIPMILYGVIADVSIGKLFAAGIIPGLILSLCFSGYIMVSCLKNPSLAPSSNEEFTWNARIKGLSQISPVLVIIIVVLGSIYMGWATPGEAAAIGTLMSIFFALLNRSINWGIFKNALMGTVVTTSMIMFIICSAAYFSATVGYLGIPRALSSYVTGSGMSSLEVLICLSAFYLILGCLVDGFSMILMSVPITLPLAVSVGIDPLWFGIYVVLMVQLAQVTPPVGFNLFIIDGISEFDIMYITKASFPFFVIMCIFIVFLFLCPQIVSFLPGLMIK